MPELLVFLRTFLVGLVLTEIWKVTYLASAGLGRRLADERVAVPLAITTLSIVCLLTYAYRRWAHRDLLRVVRSGRLDLLLFLLLGYCANNLIAPELAPLYRAIDRISWMWSPIVLAALLIFLTSALLPGRKSKGSDAAQLGFLTDEEIAEASEDVLGVSSQAEQFADAVLASDLNAGLVFGVDGPWGIGKSSFISLAEKRWNQQAGNSVIVFKFQPLRYANEADLADRFIRELCTFMHQQVFSPEFSPAASRYSRMLKGKADLSFLGFKLSLEPSNETVDELLDDIDGVLKRIGRRLVVIIDDLDRLEPKLVNNVLFTVRRTFKLTQASYVLCYDTEILIAGKDEGSRAREFLEKFITVKFGLFLDGGALARFLRSDWTADAVGSRLVPAGTMRSLSEMMEEVATILSGPDSKHYMPLLGDMRKIKRFVNALVMMRLPDLDVGRGDFQYRDLANLLLLHLCYPGVFRRIYVEESEGRTGMFSLQRDEAPNTAGLVNGEGFDAFVEGLDIPAAYLVRQLFDVETLGFTRFDQPDEFAYRTRACFNTNSRNLEAYLALIVRLIVPAPAQTYRLYIEAVEAIISGKKVEEVLASDDLSLANGEEVHTQFWSILAKNAHRFEPPVANDVITTLLASLPRYSSHDSADYGVRQQSISSLARLLDQAGFGAPRRGHVRDPQDAGEIGERIFGHAGKFPTPILDELVAEDRGALGWNDLMIFRLRCSIDRGGQLHNLYSGLLRYEDPNAVVSGQVAILATNSMRRFSQEVFKRFFDTFISGRRNFLLDVDNISDAAVFGEQGETALANDPEGTHTVAEVARAVVKDFVIFQLTNNRSSNSSGVGCGYYDQSGLGDGGGIGRAMVRYLLYFCFNPLVHESHSLVFGDFCLRSLRTALFNSMGEANVQVAQAALTNFIPREEWQRFWSTFGPTLKRRLNGEDRVVVSHSFSASYAESMPLFFEALDGFKQLSSEVVGSDA